jgi:hypothetical protein
MDVESPASFKSILEKYTASQQSIDIRTQKLMVLKKPSLPQAIDGDNRYLPINVIR